jgi:hypothetical protein
MRQPHPGCRGKDRSERTLDAYSLNCLPVCPPCCDCCPFLCLCPLPHLECRVLTMAFPRMCITNLYHQWPSLIDRCLRTVTISIPRQCVESIWMSLPVWWFHGSPSRANAVVNLPSITTHGHSISGFDYRFYSFTA